MSRIHAESVSLKCGLTMWRGPSQRGRVYDVECRILLVFQQFIQLTVVSHIFEKLMY
jgi:hypothetical protein